MASIDVDQEVRARLRADGRRLDRPPGWPASTTSRNRTGSRSP